MIIYRIFFTSGNRIYIRFWFLTIFPKTLPWLLSLTLQFKFFIGITQLSKMFEKLLAKLDERGGNGTITYAYRSRTIPGLLSGLRHLRESAIFTDITLRSGETDFPGNKFWIHWRQALMKWHSFVWSFWFLSKCKTWFFY